MKMTRLLAIIAIVAIVFSINTAYGQKLKPADVPEDVIQTMDFEYPNVKITGWELKNDTYVASFKEDNAPGQCYISKQGQWLKTVYPVPKAELPTTITDYVAENYHLYAISVSQLQQMPNVSIHYYIEARPEGVGEEASILKFNNVGTLIERKDPAHFNKETKTVVAAATASEAPAKTQANANSNKSGSSASSNKSNSANTSKSSSNTTSKSSSSSNKTSTATTSSKTSSSSTASKSNSSSSSKSTASTSTKASSSGTASKSPSSNSSTSKNSGAKTAATASATTTKTSSATASKSTPAPEKPKKQKEAKPVYDEQGHKALDPNTVPAVVKTGFSKKVQRPEELNWFKIDSFYVAKCIAREMKTEVFMTPQGAWVKTYVELPETSVTGNPLKHIQTYYKGYRFKTAVKETRADKADVMMVEIYEKANWKQKLVTTFLFDKTGKLLRTIDPNYALDGQDNESSEDESLEKYYKKMNMSNDNTAEKSSIPTDVINAFKAKYPHVSGVTWEETSDGSYQAIYYGTRGKEICQINSYGTITQTMTLGNPDNLLSTISSYIKQNYKGFKVTEYYAVKMLVDKKNFYKVIVFNKKTGIEQEVWFTTSGKYVEM